MAAVEVVTRDEMLAALAGREGKRKRPSRSETKRGARARYRCEGCDTEHPSYPAWERHADSTGHGRGRMIL